MPDESNVPLIIKGPREDIPEDLHPACKVCIESARAKYKGFTDSNGGYYSDGFSVKCSCIPASEEFLDPRLKKIMDPDDWREVNTLKSALHWAEANLFDSDTGQPWRARPYQRGPLLCNANRCVFRFGRRTGKTTILAIKALWYLFTSGGGEMKDPDSGRIRGNLKILLIAPQKVHIDNIFDRMVEFLSGAPHLSAEIERSIVSSPRKIKLKKSASVGAGNEVNGFASGDTSGGKGLSSRGQDADVVIMDEAAYVTEATIKAITPILYTRPTTKFIVSSTPSGIAGDFFERTCLQRPDFAEFYVPATMIPNWFEEREAQARADASSQEEYDKETLAKFSPAGIGVYKDELVKFAQEEYSYGEMKPNPNFVYTAGVDWNKEHGTEIVIVGTLKVPPHISYVTFAENIAKKDFTTPSGIGRIVEINRVWRPSWIYVDAGGGDGGAMLRHHGRSMAGKNLIDAALMNIVKSYDFGSKIEIADHDGTVRKAPSKPFMVEQSVRKFELGELKYPRTDLVLTRQLNNYIVLRRNAGVPVFGIREEKYGDHRLDALNLALIALRLEFTSFYNEGITPLGNPIRRVPGRDGVDEHKRILLPSPASAGKVAPMNGSRLWNRRTRNAHFGKVPEYWGNTPIEIAAEDIYSARARRVGRRIPRG